MYKFIGFYETRKDALIALADYNTNPFNIDTANITFSEVYERWSNEYFPTISDSNAKSYKASFQLCASIAGRRFVDIKLDDLQAVADNSGKNYPTLRKYKVLLNSMYKYAVIHEIIPKERNIVEYINIKKAGNPNALNREPFSREEVSRIWEVKDSNIYYTTILMLIYTGCRISEMLNLRKEDVSLQEHWFKVVASKTDAGIRTVPIADKILPFFEYWYNRSDCEYLLSTPEGKHLLYVNYLDNYWTPIIGMLGMEHRPHDTRHTCISFLAAAGVDERIIKKIVGHKGQGVTQIVYTHFEITELLDAINKI